MANQHIGSGLDDRIQGDSQQANLIVGNGGNDTLTGGAAGDVMYGGGQSSGTWTGRLTFTGEQAGYRNTLGVYEFDTQGKIHNVRIVLANASDDVVQAGHAVDVTVTNGNKVGFFILPDGWSYNSGLFEWCQRDGIAHHYELRNADSTGSGNGNVNGKPLELHWVYGPTGGSEKLVGASGHDTYHTVQSVNADGFDHSRESELPGGVTAYAFEDLPHGGDQSFSDLMFTFGKIAKPANGSANDDVMAGGDGDDRMWGGSGRDRMDGGRGDDLVDGGSGNDVLAGGEGRDEVRGGSGDDLLLAAGGGNDVLDGGAGFDTLSFAGVAGNVTLDLGKGTGSISQGGGVVATLSLKSLEGVVGGDGNDNLTGSTRDDVLVGGLGNDWLRGKAGADTLTGGDGRDTFAFAKADAGKGLDRVTDFKVGTDRLDLSDFLPGKGAKGTPWADWIRAVDSAEATTVQAKVGTVWHDLVVLEGVHTTHLADLGL